MPQRRQVSHSIEEKFFPLVGIGASAGGLEAVQNLLKNLPSNTGMAFVLVQHLDPKHESRFPDILARHTKMPVQEAKDDTAIESDHLYVIPATASMVIKDGKLKLALRKETRGSPVVIDLFFSSLAREWKNKAAGFDRQRRWYI